MHRRRTKILATLGPASSSEERLTSLLDAGLDAVRLNFSHGTKLAHREVFDRVRAVAAKAGKAVPIVQDIQGPKIRIGDIRDPIPLSVGDAITFIAGEEGRTEREIPITYANLAADVRPGDPILMDDGYLGAKVTDIVDHETVRAVVTAGGLLKRGKGVNFPGVRLSIKFPTEKDKVDLRFGQELGVDYVAASFIRSAADVSRVRAELDDSLDTRVIAKVELREAVDNIDEIVRASDGVMVARGDLGVELPSWEVPVWQKRIVDLCDALGVPAITATQMLESMIEHPRPTRAEVTDVYNAVLDGSSAVMLSGETAVGKWPVETVATMARICESAEATLENPDRPFASGGPGGPPTSKGSVERLRALSREGSIGDAVSHAACRAAEDLNAAAIVALTTSGKTARFVSKYKPARPIIGATPSERTWRRLGLLRGVEPLRVPEAASDDEILRSVEAEALRAGLLSRGDVVVVTSGRAGLSGSTDQIRVMRVGQFVAPR